MLIVSDLSRAAIFLVIASIELPTATILLLAFIAGSFDPPFEASRSALIPQLVGTEMYGHAIAISTYVSNTGLMAGYALGGGLSGWIGPSGALAVNAGTFVMSAAFVSRLPKEEGAHAVHRPDLRAAFRFVRTNRVVMWAVMIYGLVAFFGMSVEGIAAPYAVDVLHLSDIRVGLLLAMVPAGTILGTIAMRPTGSDRRLLRLSGLAALVAGVVATPVFALGWQGLLAHVGFFGIGVGFAAAVPSNTAAGRLIPDEIRASTFGILQGVVVGAHALGAATGGVVAARTSLAWGVTAGAAALAVVGLFSIVVATVLMSDKSPLESASVATD